MVTPELRARVEARVDELVALVRTRGGLWADFPRPVVDYTLTGTKAGVAYCGRNRLAVNGALLAHDPDGMIRDTVAHEIAHLVVAHGFARTWARYIVARAEGRYVLPPRRPSAHGREWRSWMHALGVRAERCHTYDLAEAGVKVKRQARHAYTCGCKTWHLTTARHNKAQRRAGLYAAHGFPAGAAMYRCPSCRGPLVYAGGAPVSYEEAVAHARASR